MVQFRRISDDESLVLTEPTNAPGMRLTGENLACRRGGRLLFEGLGLAVEAGSGLALVGPNGAGKTSLLRILAGLLAPAAGSVALAGHAGDSATAMHFCGPRDGLKSAMTPAEMLGFWQALGGIGNDNGRAEAAVAALALRPVADLPCGYLSSGQRKRVALARLLVDRRPVWLLDEPTNALDTAAQQNLARLVEDHLAAGGIVVVATHQTLPWPHLANLAIADFRPTETAADRDLFL
jgi:heme exporter protein A